MEFLLDANVAYILLVGGMSLAILAILNPGTGILELVALFALILAGWEVYHLPFNYWAFALLLVGGGLFLLSVRKTKHWGYLAFSILALVTGSAFLFRGEQWWQPSVNPILAVSVSLLSGGFFWLAARKVIEADSLQPAHDINQLVGAIGEAKTEIHEEGSVQIGAELWSARSSQFIPQGERVRVVAREGFVLIVEPCKPDPSSIN